MAKDIAWETDDANLVVKIGFTVESEIEQLVKAAVDKFGNQQLW